MQIQLNFVDWDAWRKAHLLKENIRLNAENQKLNFRLRAYRGWKTKRKNKKI